MSAIMSAFAECRHELERLAFELTHHPKALFKNQLMRKPDKAPLRNVLLAEKATIYPEKTKGKYILDGGALMYHVYWWKGLKFKEISVAYVSYVRKNCF